MKRILNIILWEIEYRAFELFNSVMFIGFGVAVLFLQSTQRIISLSFGDFGWNVVMYGIATVLIGGGFLELTAVISNKIQFRKYTALIASFIWMSMLVMFYVPPVKPTSIAFFIVLILFTSWSFIRLVMEHRGKRLLDPRDKYGQ